jgi:hypothetical protein
MRWLRNNGPWKLLHELNAKCSTVHGLATQLFHGASYYTCTREMCMFNHWNESLIFIMNVCPIRKTIFSELNHTWNSWNSTNGKLFQHSTHQIGISITFVSFHIQKETALPTKLIKIYITFYTQTRGYTSIYRHNQKRKTQEEDTPPKTLVQMLLNVYLNSEENKKLFQ